MPLSDTKRVCFVRPEQGTQQERDWCDLQSRGMLIGPMNHVIAFLTVVHGPVRNARGIPHLGHLPGFSSRTSGCIEHVYSALCRCAARSRASRPG